MSFCCSLPSRCSSTVFPFARRARRARRNGNGSEAPRLHVQDAYVLRTAGHKVSHGSTLNRGAVLHSSEPAEIPNRPENTNASAPNIVSPSPAPHIPAMAPKRSVFRSNTPTWSAPYGVKYATSL